VRRLGELIGHFQEEQHRELFDVFHTAESRLLQNACVAPCPLSDLRCVHEELLPALYDRCEFSPVVFKPCLELLNTWQDSEIARHEEFLIHSRRGELNFRTVFVTAKQNSDGRIVTFGHHVGFEPVHVEIHLSCVRRSESADLEINQYMTSQQSVIEDEINTVVFAALGHPKRTCFKAESPSEFEQESLQMIQQSRLQLILRVLGAFRESSEFKHIRITQHVGDGLLRLLFSRPFNDGLLVPGQPRAFVKQAFDLPLELTFRPMAGKAFVLVERSLPRIVYSDQLNEMCPRKSDELLWF